jgi:hypothetical protein
VWSIEDGVGRTTALRYWSSVLTELLIELISILLAFMCINRFFNMLAKLSSNFFIYKYFKAVLLFHSLINAIYGLYIYSITVY